MDKGDHNVRGKECLATTHELQAGELRNWKQTKHELSDIKMSRKELQIPKPLGWENIDAF